MPKLNYPLWQATLPPGIFLEGTPMTNNPEFPPPPSPSADPATVVKLPAMCLMVIGSIGILGSFLGLMLVITGLGISWLGGSFSGGGMGAGALGITMRTVFLLLQCVIALAGWRMGKLRNYPSAMAGSVLAIIPCISPCCVVGIPFGIWALVVLMKPGVKAAFDLTPGIPPGH